MFQRRMPRRESEARAEALYNAFQEQAADLYWLAYLLTGDSEQTVQAFASALEFDGAPNPVFRGFIVSWARKLVMASALATITTKLRASALRVDQPELGGLGEHSWESTPICHRQLG